jgi:uncharacterized membrane protein YjfL (UPF0719 family)
MNDRLETLFYLGLGLALCRVGKLFWARLHPRVAVDRELTGKDNFAFAVVLGCYYFGLLIALGAAIGGPSLGSFAGDVLAAALWGLGAIALLNLGAGVVQRFIFSGPTPFSEIVSGGNVSMGVLLGGNYVANGLLLSGAISATETPAQALLFWGYGLMWLLLSSRALSLLLRYELAPQIRRDNRAVALSSAGALIGIGNVLRLALAGPDMGISSALAAVTGYSLAGIAALLLVREICDRLLLPGVTVREEILAQNKPNTGVGLVVGLFYAGASILVGWAL